MSEFEGKELNDSIRIDGRITPSPEITKQQKVFLLSHVDFLKLTSNNSLLHAIPFNFFLVWLGYALSLSPKVLNILTQKGDHPTNNEWMILLISLILIVVVWFIVYLLPSESKDVQRKMKEYFCDSDSNEIFINGGPMR